MSLTRYTTGLTPTPTRSKAWSRSVLVTSGLTSCSCDTVTTEILVRLRDLKFYEFRTNATQNFSSWYPLLISLWLYFRGIAFTIYQNWTIKSFTDEQYFKFWFDPIKWPGFYKAKIKFNQSRFFFFIGVPLVFLHYLPHLDTNVKSLTTVRSSHGNNKFIHRSVVNVLKIIFSISIC